MFNFMYPKQDATEEDLGNVVRTETNDKSSGSPSITNIIDFRPLFNRLFHGDQAMSFKKRRKVEYKLFYIINFKTKTHVQTPIMKMDFQSMEQQCQI